jgi:tetratricopeptide (TPR) repeat protein
VKNLITNWMKKLKENEQIAELIDELKENEQIVEHIKKIKKNKFINSIVKLVKNKFFIPTVTGILCISLLTGIIVKVKSTITIQTMIKDSIATNVAELDFYNGKYDEAITEYTKLQEKDEWPIWNAKIAEIYSVEGDTVKSNEIIRKVYEARNKIADTKKEKIESFESKDKELINYIVFTFLINGQSSKAVEYGELFLNNYPSDKTLLRTMFMTYLVNGNNDKAKEIINNYPVDNESAIDLATLARMSMIINNFDKGFSLLKNAWDMDKNEIKVFDVISQAADYNKNDIIDKISKLQKKEPNEPAYKMWMAKIYSMNKDTAEKAEKLVDELQSENVGNTNLMLIEANMYQSLGEIDKSKEALDKVVKNDKNSFIGYQAAAWQSYDNENYDEAFKDCKKSIISNRDYPDNYRVLLPEILEKQDKSGEVEPYLRTALYKEPFNYSIIIKMAEYYGSIVKDSTKALYYYDLASKLNPKDAEVYYNMALIKIRNQRESEAIDLLKKSISINDKIAKYHRALGSVYLNKEKNDDSIREIRSAYAIDKNDILTLNNAACYYISVEGDLSRGMINLKAAYDGINEKITPEDKETITNNYNKIKSLSDAYNKKSGTKLKVADLKSFY